MAEILTPNCPLCGQPPLFAFGNDQPFCGNRDNCTLILWNPTLSLDDNLMDAGVVQFPGEGPDAPA
jgi:hypothetical protein